MDRTRTERVILGLIWIGLALLLFTPFVVSEETVFPFVVGKALYSRSLIEVVFLAWAVLAFLQPDYRPPRSYLLILLGVSVGVGALSACFGVSVQRSFWSNFERMQGVLDQAHWFALAVVLVSVVRMPQWRILLQAQLVFGLGIAFWAVGQFFDVGWFVWKESATGYLRISTTLGNPIYLGGYAFVNCLLAAGFFVRSWMLEGKRDGGVDDAAQRVGGARTRRPSGPGTRGIRLVYAVAKVQPCLVRVFWGSVVLLNAWVVTLAGARGPFLGLLAGVVAVGAVYAWLARGRIRLVAAGVAGLFAVGVVLLVVSITVAPDPSREKAQMSNPLLERLAAFSKSTVDTRLSAWNAGLKGFAEAPVLGWGPENFLVVFGRHADAGIGSEMLVHDHAHNKLVEELATKGVVGLIAHLVLWAAILVALLRAAKAVDRKQRALLLFAGAALAGQFVQRLTSPDSADAWLLFTLLFGLVATIASQRPAAGAPRPPDRARPRIPVLARTLGGRRVRAAGGLVLLVGAAGLAGAGLFANQAAYSSARILAITIKGSVGAAIDPSEVRALFALAIAEFDPLANEPRTMLFKYTTQVWRVLRVESPAEAARLMELASAQASAAVRSEPENWELHATIARLYHKAGVTNPEYREMAARHAQTARRLAPNRTEVRSLPVSNIRGDARSNPERGQAVAD